MKRKTSRFTIIILFIVGCTAIHSQAKKSQKVNFILFSQTEKDADLIKSFFGKDTLLPVRKREYSLRLQDSVFHYVKKFYREKSKNEELVPDKEGLIKIKPNSFIETNGIRSPFDRKRIERMFIERRFNAIEVQKFVNDQKTIQGIPCYKVIIKSIENDNDRFKSVAFHEMYVSDVIKLNYHPVIGAQTFLSEFYPLEIKSSGTLEFKSDSLSSQEIMVKKAFDRLAKKDKRYTLQEISFSE